MYASLLLTEYREYVKGEGTATTDRMRRMRTRLAPPASICPHLAMEGEYR